MNHPPMRAIVQRQTAISEAQPVDDVLQEMKRLAQSGNYAYLLAHADDEVIWGRVEKGKLLTARNIDREEAAPLRLETLQEARLFGEQAEAFFWPTEAGWMCRRIQDGQGDELEHYDEAWILWGTSPAGAAVGGFYPVQETDTGIRHAPPVEMADRHFLRLLTRHYLDYDERGAVFVCASRLVGLVDQATSIAGRLKPPMEGKA